MYEQAILAIPQRSWEQTYPGTADQLRHVRSALREFLGGCPVADDAVCLLSELCANAILHSDSGKTGGTLTVRAQHAVNRYVRGEVEDQGSDWHGDLAAVSHPSPRPLPAPDPGLGMRRRADRPCSRRLVPPRLPAPNPTGGQHVTTGHHPQPASRDQADRHLAAVAAGVTGHGISPCLSRIGDVPVLTIEEPTGGPDPTTVSINPDLSDPGHAARMHLPVDTAPRRAPRGHRRHHHRGPERRPPASRRAWPRRRGHISPMTTAPAAAGQPGRDDLTERIFRALYQEFDLRTINGTYVVVPKGTPWFAGTSLGDIARQISDHTPGPGRFPGRARADAATTSSAQPLSHPAGPVHARPTRRDSLATRHGQAENQCLPGTHCP